jgi:hypothetical protein
MSPDDLALRATAWLSLAAWGASEWARSSGGRAREKRARALFTLGALALAAHTGLALHLRHAWSQGDAIREIARQTEEVTGVAFSGGLFVNYAFLAFWGAELLWWWRSPAGYARRPATLAWASRGVFLFMFVNGAIVFGRGPVRAFGVLVVLGVFSSWYRGRMHDRAGREEPAHG